MSLTCIACKVLFASSEFHRDHYKSDWHRYNLQRKIAELPSITKEEFDQKAAAHNEARKEETTWPCEVCHKYFATENSLLNHLKSQKHVETVLKLNTGARNKEPRRLKDEPEKVQTSVKSEMGLEEDVTVSSDGEYGSDDSDWESCDDDDEEIVNGKEIIRANRCLFCLFESDTIENNVNHMTVSHSFYIPDIEYLSDLEGFLSYLGKKVGTGFMCLWCNGKGKSYRSSKAAQQHMLDKGHCKILHEGEALLECENFYDYTSSYPDGSERNADEEISVAELEGDSYQLVLPSGAVIGHRSLALYYKQNLRPLRPENTKAIDRIMKHYKALGWTGTTGQVAVKKAKDLSFMRRLRSKQALRLSVKKNKFQPHFRNQVVF